MNNVEMDGASGMYGGQINEYMKHSVHLGVNVRIILKLTLVRNIVRFVEWINLVVDKEQRLGVVHTVTNLTNAIKCVLCVCVFILSCCTCGM